MTKKPQILLPEDAFSRARWAPRGGKASATVTLVSFKVFHLSVGGSTNDEMFENEVVSTFCRFCCSLTAPILCSFGIYLRPLLPTRRVIE